MSEDRNAAGVEPEDELEIPEDDPEPEELDPPEHPDEDPEPDPEPELAQPSKRRGSERVQTLANEVKALKQERAEFERQLRELTQRQREPSPAERAEAERIERERFELLSPWDQKQYLENRIGTAVENRVQQIQSGLWDQNDRTSYDSLLASNPRLRRFAEAVEETRKQAPNVSRKVILEREIGRAALENMGAAETRGRKRTEGERERLRGAPSNGRADVPASERRRSGGSIEDRLRGQRI